MKGRILLLAVVLFLLAWAGPAGATYRALLSSQPPFTGWSVPVDWNPAHNWIDCIGAGGSGCVGGGGGAGGGFARLYNQPLPVGFFFPVEIPYQVTSGVDTWFMTLPPCSPESAGTARRRWAESRGSAALGV